MNIIQTIVHFAGTFRSLFAKCIEVSCLQISSSNSRFSQAVESCEMNFYCHLQYSCRVLINKLIETKGGSQYKIL